MRGRAAPRRAHSRGRASRPLSGQHAPRLPAALRCAAQVRFVFDGTRVNPQSTPADLGMEDGETIDAFLEVGACSARCACPHWRGRIVRPDCCRCCVVSVPSRCCWFCGTHACPQTGAVHAAASGKGQGNAGAGGLLGQPGMYSRCLAGHTRPARTAHSLNRAYSTLRPPAAPAANRRLLMGAPAAKPAAEAVGSQRRTGTLSARLPWPAQAGHRFFFHSVVLRPAVSKR